MLVNVYLFQDRHDLGEILLSLNYLPCAGRLNIDVIKAKQLLQTDLVDGSGKLKTQGQNIHEWCINMKFMKRNFTRLIHLI